MFKTVVCNVEIKGIYWIATSFCIGLFGAYHACLLFWSIMKGHRILILRCCGILNTKDAD